LGQRHANRFAYKRSFLFPSGKASRAYCENLAAKLGSRTAREIPASCQEYLQPNKIDPFAGMQAGSAASARSHRSKGHEYHAQVQRRLTNGTTRRFSKKN